MRILTSVLFWLILTADAFGAVAYDTSATSIDDSSDPTVSLTINASGSNRLLLCGAHYINGASLDVTSITHNGIGLTQSDQGEIATAGYAVDVYYLKQPDTGSQTVTLTMSGTGGYPVLTCITFTGVDQTTPLGTGGNYTGYDDPGTVTVTIPTDGMAALFATNSDYTKVGTITVDGNSTKQFDVGGAVSSQVVAVGSTTTTAGAQTVSNPDPPGYEALISMPMNPAGAAPPAAGKRVISVVVW